MKDPRIEKLASLLLNYSIAVKPKQRILINGESGSEPLLMELFNQCLQAGAYPFVATYPDSYFPASSAMHNRNNFPISWNLT